MKILLTGYTGNLGPEIVSRLAQHEVTALVRDPATAPRLHNIRFVHGDLDSLQATRPTLLAGTEIVVHGAACTSFRADPADLRRTNVGGTLALLTWARECPRLRKFVHLSTTCVSGDRGGVLPLAPLHDRPGFINAYEASKWEAEAAVLASQLPVEIVRIATVAGNLEDGAVRNPGAFHHMLRWLYRGLVPMLPGLDRSGLDLISTEYAAARVVCAALSPPMPGRIHHASAGLGAPLLSDLVAYAAERFSAIHPAWRNGSILPPDIVDPLTYELFERSVRTSGDLLLSRICELSQSFLPALLHPFSVEVDPGDAAPAWQPLVANVITSLTQSPLTSHA